MEASAKPEKQQRSSIGALHKAAILLVVLGICAGYFAGLELLRRRLNTLEETVNGLSEICKNADQASHSNQRNRRESPPFVTLGEVRKEIQAQLSSITASQLCSAPDKICLSGPPGPKGDPGIEGRRGKRGYLGIKGDPGDPGLKGMKGFPGPKGDMGDMGSNGLPGMKGDTGYPGSPGLDGEKGEPGMTGFTGPPGLDGQKGEPGMTGFTGPPGLDGQKGEQGMAGFTGPPGLDGQKGEPGMTGFTGPPGIKGDAGMPGMPGPKGDMGYPGPPGLNGEKGEPGMEGFAGPPGINGDTGMPGLPGPKGDMGYPGPPGFDGEKGEPGPGMKGFAVPPGIKGDAGMPGLPGPKGNMGMPGYDGPAGPKGERGQKGDKGEPGEGSSGNAPTIYISPSTLTVLEGSKVQFKRERVDRLPIPPKGGWTDLKDSPVSFSCYATGQPAPTIRWERVGKEQVPQGSSGSLTIAKAQSWHSGQYKCMAFNSHGMTEATVKFKVEGKPVVNLESFDSRRQKITVRAYDDVTISCDVRGYPAPDVKWFKADKTNLPEGRTEIRNDSLVIRNIREEESGTYVCRAQNAYGSAKMKYSVVVARKSGPRSGRDRNDAARSCKELKAQIPSSPSGKYWIDPDLGAPDNAFEAYCDQETDGGGWMLVWSYRFVKSEFMTPRPSFPAGSSGYDYMSPLSTTLPLDPSSLGAMKFSLWKTYGTEMLLKSDLINWYVCKDGSGSILNWKTGSISCHVAKALVAKCNNTAPSYFNGHMNYGMDLTDGLPSLRNFYKVEVMAWRYPGYPTRRLDSCANGGGNFVKGLDDPRGAWFVR